MTLTVGLVAAFGVIVSWQQKNSADRRSEWWRRTGWAFERTFSTSDTEVGLGWKMLDTLAKSKLATRGDSDIVHVIAEHAALVSAGLAEGEDHGRGSSGRDRTGGTRS